MRQVLRLEQGSEAWKAHRNTPGMINGSEIAAIMGLSSYVTRAEILRRKATGIEPEHDAATLARFAKGHKYEALARPLAESLIDDDLSALVITDTIDGLLFSVSLDGITQGNDITHEHKSLNQALAAALDAGYLPDEYHPQCESGLMVSGATRCLFMASKWDDDDNLIEEKHIWYESNPELRARMIAACKQFEIDRINYVHVEQTVAPTGRAPDSLPALLIEVTGMVTASNLTEFKQHAMTVFDGIKTALVTDADFADAEKTVKWCKEVEDRLDAAKSHALAQTASIDELFRVIDQIKEESRSKRLALDKLVKAEKTNRKAEIINQARVVIEGHIDNLNKRIGGQWVKYPDGGLFAAATTGLKSLDSMRDKVATALANAKIEANEIADRIELNAKQITVDGANYNYLVHDFAQVCTKPTDDFAAIMAQRIAAHKAAEAAQKTVVLDPAKPAGDVIPPQAVALAPEAKRAVLVEAGDEVRAYLNTLGMNDKEFGRLRAVILGWEQHKAELALKVAA